MTTSYVDVRIESEEFSTDDSQVQRVRGKEAISQLFSFDIRAVFPGAALDLEAAVGAGAALVFLRDDVEIRRVHGMILEAHEQLDVQTEAPVYDLRLVPRVARLSLIETQEIFLHMTVPAIIEQKLRQVGLGSDDFELRLFETYPEREFVVQYRETDLAFISRLAEHLGVSYFFDHEGGVDRIVFTDRQEGFPRGARVHLRTRGERRDLYGLSRRARLIPSTYIVQDYNYRTPQVELSAAHELSDGYAGGVIEVGGHFKTPEEGAALARVRAEERQATRVVYTGESEIPPLSAGLRVEVAGPRADDLLVVEIEHEADRPTLTAGGSEQEGPHYKNVFRAVPAGPTYRPPRRTPRPRIHGLVSGVIHHGIEHGVERWAKLDDQGRYTVRFMFDTAEHPEKQSGKIRMLQPHVGTHYGMHFPLKPGAEVLIGFVDGDPDRPVIVGAAYRPDTPNPVTKGSHDLNRLKTESGVIIEIRDA